MAQMVNTDVAIGKVEFKDQEMAQTKKAVEAIKNSTVYLELKHESLLLHVTTKITEILLNKVLEMVALLSLVNSIKAAVLTCLFQTIVKVRVPMTGAVQSENTEKTVDILK